MQERELIRSYNPNTKKFLKVMMIIAIVLSMLIFLTQCSSGMSNYNEYKEVYDEHREDGSCGYYYSSWERCWRCEYVEDYSVFSDAVGPAISCFLAIMVLALLIKLLLSSFSLVVTDKRIYCKTLWIHHVCLPVDSITAVARVGLINFLAIGAPAGRIYVSFVMNSKAIYTVLNDLLIARQEKSLASVMGIEE